MVWRGGLFPLAYVSPAAMGATRDCLRRRCPLGRQRATLVAPIQNTKSQDNLPELGQKLADKAHRAGVAEHLPAPGVRKPIALEVSLSEPYDQLVGEVAL